MIYRLSVEERRVGLLKLVPSIVITLAQSDFMALHQLLNRYVGTQAVGEGHGAFARSFAHVGFRDCGIVEPGDEQVRLVFLLRKSHADALAETFVIVFGVLTALVLEREDLAVQDLVVQTVVARRGVLNYGISGLASRDFCRNLIRESMLQGETLNNIIEEAMRTVWKAVAFSEGRRYGSHCKLFVDEDGRFLFRCFGNACDSGIYPDGTGTPVESKVSYISSHNVDCAAQQLTLLTGYARLHELINVI